MAIMVVEAQPEKGGECMSYKTFWEKWNIALQTDVQKGKLSCAMGSEYRPEYTSRSALTCTFKGNRKTIVCNLGLYTCNCDEFWAANKDKVPCCHLYRTAVECGVVDKYGVPIVHENNPEAYPNREKLFIEFIDRLETTLSIEQQQSFMKSIQYRIHCRDIDGLTNPERYQYHDVTPLIEMGIFEKISDANIAYLYGFGWAYSDIPNRILHSELQIPVDLKRNKHGSVSKRAIQSWALTIPDEVSEYIFPADNAECIVARPTTQFVAIHDLVAEYFNRKFVDKSTYNYLTGDSFCHPYGAIVLNYWKQKVMFPDDIVSSLLETHQCNRCISGQIGLTESSYHYIHKETSRGRSFSIKLISETDKECMTKLLLPIVEFYANSHKETSDYVDVILALSKLDAYLENEAQAGDMIQIMTIKELLLKTIKSPDEIKKDFLKLTACFDDGTQALGYSAILSKLHMNKHIVNISSE